MPIVDGWIDWADTSIKGRPEKVYSAPNRGEGVILHSVVGDLPGHGVPDRFLSMDRDANGRFTPYAAASVMFILYRDGWLRQMYPVTASTWTSGGPEANTRYWAVELEGGGPGNYSEPITLEAARTLTQLVLEWQNYSGYTASEARIFGHSDAARRWNYAPTACPSGRYDWWLDQLFRKGVQQTMATIDSLLALEARVARVERLLAGWGVLTVSAAEDNLSALESVLGWRPPIGARVELKGEQTLAYLDLMQNNMWLGLANTQADVAQLKARRP